jgi:hypothetical protein
MDFNLSPIQNTWQARAQQVVAALPPDATAERIVAAAAQAQLLDAEEDLLAAVVAVEAFAAASASAAVVLALHTCVVRSIGDHPAIQALTRGELVGGLALSADQHPAGGPRAAP